MFQDIVLGAQTLRSIADLVPAEFHELMSGLYTERFVCDSKRNLFKEYVKVIERLPQHHQEMFGQWLAFITQGQHFCDDQVSTDLRSLEVLPEYISELQIALADTKRVVLADPNESIVNRKEVKAHRLCVANCSEYLRPELSPLIRGIETLVFEKGDNFNFRAWIAKYIFDAKSLKIHDPYACVSPSQRQDFKHILGLFKHNPAIQIEVIMLASDKVMSPKSFIKSVQKEFNMLNIRINTVIDEDSIKDRYIETHLFHIDLGHALGSVNEVTQTVRKQFSVSVTPLGRVRKH
jgi:hypothetical protein